MISERLWEHVPLCDAATTVAYTTWTEIADVVMREADTYESDDQSALRAIRRIAASAAGAIAAHS